MADFNVKTLEADLDFAHLAFWDVIIIGAGPAGLAAGLTTAHRALTTLIIEAKDSPGGQPHFLYADKRIVDIPGFPDGITGEELSERTYRQAVNALVQFRFNEELLGIEDTDEVHDGEPMKRVVTSANSIFAAKSSSLSDCCTFHAVLQFWIGFSLKTFITRIPRLETTRASAWPSSAEETRPWTRP